MTDHADLMADGGPVQTALTYFFVGRPDLFDATMQALDFLVLNGLVLTASELPLQGRCWKWGDHIWRGDPAVCARCQTPYPPALPARVRDQQEEADHG